MFQHYALSSYALTCAPLTCVVAAATALPSLVHLYACTLCGSPAVTSYAFEQRLLSEPRAQTTTCIAYANSLLCQGRSSCNSANSSGPEHKQQMLMLT